MSDEQQPPDTPDVPADLKMPEVEPRKPDIRSFPKGVPRNDMTSGTSSVNNLTPAVKKLTPEQKRVARETRRREIYQMVLDGVPYREIAERMQIGVATAHRCAEAYREAQNKLAAAPIEDQRLRRVAQLERNIRRASDILADERSAAPLKATALTAINAAVAEASRIEGSAMPTKIASTNPDGTSWAPLAVALQGYTTEQLQLLKRFNEDRLLGDAPRMPAMVVDAEVIEVKKAK